MSFQTDLNQAQEVEQLLLDILLGMGNDAELNGGTDLNDLRKGDIIIHYNSNRHYYSIDK